MGCQVTSIYADQVIGKLGFSNQLIQDLVNRDFHSNSELLEYNKLTLSIKNIYGFTQSFTTAGLYFTMIKQKECMVYTAGRFVVIEQTKNNQQRLIANKSIISAFTVSGKLCLTGLQGGLLLLWDLQFLQTKLQIMLPQGSTTVTSISLTPKYIFATDNNQPNNYGYCYDIRTAKLKAHIIIPSMQPILKSISIDNDMHVFCSADGIWFMRRQKDYPELQIMKGMFGRYPKTSMSCIGVIGEYVVSGGIDGYVYVWKISSYKCSRALKVSDEGITALVVKGKYIVFGVAGGRVKVYTFQTKKKQKKESQMPYVGEIQQNQEQNQIVTFILVDSYEHEGNVFSIATSTVESQLYYCQTRQGLFFRKWLPAQSAQQRKTNNRQFQSQTFQKLNTNSKLTLKTNKIYSYYRFSSHILNVDIHSIKGDQIDLVQERVGKTRDKIDPIDMAFHYEYNQLVYLTMMNKLFVCQTFNKQVEGVQTTNKSDLGNYNQQIQDLKNQKLLSINFTYSSYPLLCVSTDTSITIYKRTAKLQYVQIMHRPYEKVMPKSLKVQDRQLIYEQVANRWKDKQQKCTSITKQQYRKYELIHGGKILSVDTDWLQLKISCGNGSLILWK